MVIRFCCKDKKKGPVFRVDGGRRRQTPELNKGHKATGAA